MYIGRLRPLLLGAAVALCMGTGSAAMASTSVPSHASDYVNYGCKKSDKNHHSHGMKSNDYGKNHNNCGCQYGGYSGGKTTDAQYGNNNNNNCGCQYGGYNSGKTTHAQYGNNNNNCGCQYGDNGHSHNHNKDNCGQGSKP